MSTSISANYWDHSQLQKMSGDPHRERFVSTPFQTPSSSKQGGWILPAYLEQPPWPIPVQKGFKTCLFLLAWPSPWQGLFSSGAEPATPWYSFIYRKGVTCDSTTGKSGERRWRGMPWKHIWMIFTLFHPFYKMRFHLFSCSSDSLLHTE